MYYRDMTTLRVGRACVFRATSRRRTTGWANVYTRSILARPPQLQAVLGRRDENSLLTPSVQHLRDPLSVASPPTREGRGEAIRSCDAVNIFG